MTPACPHDHHPLTIRDAQGHVGHACDRCQGIWLSRRFLQSMELDRPLNMAHFQEAFRAQLRQATALPCPAGCGSLDSVYAKGIELDWCPRCEGLWFDQGEVAKLLARYPVRAPQSKSGSVGDAVDLADVIGGIVDLFN